VLGTTLVTLLREGLRQVETSLGNSGLVGDVFGLTEVALAILLIVILISRPEGIIGGQELRWPLWKRRKPAEEEGV